MASPGVLPIIAFLLLFDITQLVHAKSDPEDLQLYKRLISEVKTYGEACTLSAQIADEEHLFGGQFQCEKGVSIIKWNKWYSKLLSFSTFDELEETLAYIHTPKDPDVSEVLNKLTQKAKESFAKGINTISRTFEEPISPPKVHETLLDYGSRKLGDVGLSIKCATNPKAPVCVVRSDPFLSEIAELNQGLAEFLHDKPGYWTISKVILGLYKSFQVKEGTLNNIASTYLQICSLLGIHPFLLLLTVSALIYMFREEASFFSAIALGSLGLAVVPSLMAFRQLYNQVKSINSAVLSSIITVVGVVTAFVLKELQDSAISTTILIMFLSLFVGYVVYSMASTPNWKNMFISLMALFLVYTMAKGVTDQEVKSTLLTMYEKIANLTLTATDGLKNIPEMVSESQQVTSSSDYLGIVNKFTVDRFPFMSNFIRGDQVSIYAILGSSMSFALIVASAYVKALGGKIYRQSRDFFTVSDNNSKEFGIFTGIGLVDICAGLSNKTLIAISICLIAPAFALPHMMYPAILTIVMGGLIGVILFYSTLAASFRDAGKTAGRMKDRSIVSSDSPLLVGRVMHAESKSIYSMMKVVCLVVAVSGSLYPIMGGNSVLLGIMIPAVVATRMLSNEHSILVVSLITTIAWGTWPHIALSAAVIMVRHRGMISFDLANLDLAEDLTMAIDLTVHQ